MNSPDLKSLFAQPALSKEEKEFRAWLKLNRETLQGRSPDEVAHMAVLCGFEIADICKVLSSFTAAMQGGNIDNYAAMIVFDFEECVKWTDRMKLDLERVPELDLMPLWKELVANTVTGDPI